MKNILYSLFTLALILLWSCEKDPAPVVEGPVDPIDTTEVPVDTPAPGLPLGHGMALKWNGKAPRRGVVGPLAARDVDQAMVRIGLCPTIG